MAATLDPVLRLSAFFLHSRTIDNRNETNSVPVLIVSFFLSFPFFSFLSFLSPHPGRKTNHRPTILDHTDKSTPVNFSFRAFPRQKFESNRYIRTSGDKFQASLRKGRKRERGRRIVGIERFKRKKEEWREREIIPG